MNGQDPLPTPVPGPLLVELIKNIAELTREVEALKLKLDDGKNERRQLAVDVRCLSDGMKQFQEKFEPYLVRAVSNEKLWADRRSNWVTMVIGAGILGGCSLILYALGDYAVVMIKAKLAALETATRAKQ